MKHFFSAALVLISLNAFAESSLHETKMLQLVEKINAHAGPQERTLEPGGIFATLAVAQINSQVISDAIPSYDHCGDAAKSVLKFHPYMQVTAEEAFTILEDGAASIFISNHDGSVVDVRDGVSQNDCTSLKKK